MSQNDPPLTDEAARALLARAVELDAHLGSAVSVSELRAAALEAGISAVAFDAAVAERQQRAAAVPSRSAWRLLRQNLLAGGAFWLILELILRPAVWLNAAAPVRTLGMLLATAAGIRIADRLDARVVRQLLIALGAGQAVLFVFELAGITGAGTNVLTWAVTCTGVVAALAESYQGRRALPPKDTSARPDALLAAAADATRADDGETRRPLRLSVLARPLRHAVATLGAIVAASGCGDSATDPATTPTSLTIQGTVRDSATAPVPGALVYLSVWSPDSGIVARGSTAMATVDGAGAFQVLLDSLSDAPIDSVRVFVLRPGCGVTPMDTLLPGPLLASALDSAATVALVLPAAQPVAQAVPGQYCAFGVHSFWGPGSYKFFIKIDSTSAESLWGLWDLKYRFGSADDEGSFRGGISPDTINLFLTQDMVWNACLTMQVSIPVGPTGAWGPATIVGSQQCLVSPRTFQFVADTTPWIFFP